MKWERNAEMRLKALLKIDLCQHRLPAQYADAEQSAVVFGVDMGQMPVLMGVGGDKRHKYFVLDGSFHHFHYLTHDHHGDVMLWLLCNPSAKVALDNPLPEGYSDDPNRFSGPVSMVI